jgi:uncharacterized protein (DUF1330 family)
MLLRLTLALAVAVGAAAAMKASQAAEDIPWVGVYEANVTDMEAYKANFLTPLQPKMEADIQERWIGKTKEIIGKVPENRVVIALYPSKARLDAFWNESKDLFKIGQKYSTGMRLFAAPAMMPLPALANNQLFEVWEANVTDENGYKNDFLKAIEPKLQKHKVAFLARGFNIGEGLIGEAPKNRIAITVMPNQAAEQAYLDDTKDEFKLVQKYADVRWYSMEGVAQK